MITQSEGSVFLAYGSGTWRYVCAAADTITLPAGDVNTVYTLGTDYGEWVPARVVRGAPGAPTTSLTVRLETARDELLKIIRGPVAVRVNFSTTGQRADPLNYTSAIILLKGEVSERSISAPVSLEPSTDVVQATVNFTFTDYLLWEKLATRLISPNAVTMVKAEPSAPASACSDQVDCMERLYAISSTGFLTSMDGGLSWSSTSLSFQPSTVAKFGQYYYVGGGTSAAPASIARSADGTNFTVTTLATANDAIVTDFARSPDGIIYATTSDGKIFYSINSGASWSIAYSGTSGLNAITVGKALVVAVGAAGAVVYGRGSDFNQTTVGTSDLVGVAENWRNIFVLMSATEATMWAPRLSPSSLTVGSGINSVGFVKGLIGVAVSTSNIYVTEDGGVSWYELPGVSGGQNVVATDCESWLMTNSNGITVIEPTTSIC